MADLAAAEMWKTVGVIVVALITAWSTVRIRGAAGSSKTPAPAGEDTLTVPTPPGRLPIEVDVSGLPAELASVVHTMADTIDHTLAVLAEQAQVIGRVQVRIGDLQSEVARHERVISEWQRWYRRLVSDWSTVRQRDEPPVPPTD